MLNQANPLLPLASLPLLSQIFCQPLTTRFHRCTAQDLRVHALGHCVANTLHHWMHVVTTIHAKTIQIQWFSSFAHDSLIVWKITSVIKQGEESNGRDSSMVRRPIVIVPNWKTQSGHGPLLSVDLWNGKGHKKKWRRRESNPGPPA